MITLKASDDDKRLKDKARAWIARVYSKFAVNPMNPRQRIIMLSDEEFAIFELGDGLKPGFVTIEWFQAYPLRGGVGTKAMKILQDLATKDGISFDLYVWDKGRVSKTALTRFYKSVGFKQMSKGSQDMIWSPSN
jgi:hypothetical protein